MQGRDGRGKALSNQQGVKSFVRSSALQLSNVPGSPAYDFKELVAIAHASRSRYLHLFKLVARDISLLGTVLDGFYIIVASVKTGDSAMVTGPAEARRTVTWMGSTMPG